MYKAMIPSMTMCNTFSNLFPRVKWVKTQSVSLCIHCLTLMKSSNAVHMCMEQLRSSLTYRQILNAEWLRGENPLAKAGNSYL